MVAEVSRQICLRIWLILICMANSAYLSNSNNDKQNVSSVEFLETDVNYNKTGEISTAEPMNITVNYNGTYEIGTEVYATSPSSNVSAAESWNSTVDFNVTSGALYSSDYYATNKAIHGIASHSDIMPNEFSSGIWPVTHPQYVVQNIGRVKVNAKTKYGTAFGWIGDISSYIISPSVRQVLKSYGLYYVTGVKIYNEQSTRAIVYVIGGTQKTDNSPWAGYDKNKALKGAFAMGVKYIPYVGSGLSALISAFWPENKPSVWEQVYEQVKTLLDDKIQQTISAILDGDIRYMKEKIAALDRETKSYRKSALSSHYMNIAEDLIGFEQKFEFKATSTPDYLITNFNILPQYVTVITMKMHFYAIGIGKPEIFQLSPIEIKMIKQYAYTTLYGTNSNGAISYVRNMYKDVLDHTYNTVYTGGLYNVMMNARNYIALHGLELIPVWEQAYNDPASNKHPYIDAISYSDFFGRATPDLFQQATPTEMVAPLTPTLKSDKTRTKLLSIECYIWRIYGTGPSRVGGLKLTFEGSNNYTLGTTSNEVQRLDLNGRTITKLRAHGGGAVDELIFTLSDGSTTSLGSSTNRNYVDFELKDHHIASLYLAIDAVELGGQAANVAVSFIQNPLEK